VGGQAHAGFSGNTHRGSGVAVCGKQKLDRSIGGADGAVQSKPTCLRPNVVLTHPPRTLVGLCCRRHRYDRRVALNPKVAPFEQGGRGLRTEASHQDPVSPFQLCNNYMLRPLRRTGSRTMPPGAYKCYDAVPTASRPSSQEPDWPRFAMGHPAPGSAARTSDVRAQEGSMCSDPSA